MSSSQGDSTPARQPTWAVHRQDDNGNQFVVRTGLTQEEAERLVAEYTAKGHKQLYWAEVEK
jgi:hypothetical protein